MKIILSRKGFDSSYGGVASPIFPDGRMVSLPIPYRGEPRTYEQIGWDGGSLAPVVESLTKGAVGRARAVHLDPDLRVGALRRERGWRPAFGQIGAAQRHLANQGVGVGDLFLFFGWFRRVNYDEVGRLGFVRTAPNVHCLFGWLQVGEVLDVGERLTNFRKSHPWLADHPHLTGHACRQNTIYVASDRLTVAGRAFGLSGGGVFDRFREGLCLTARGRLRSVWDLPGWMAPENGAALSYHGGAGCWETREDGRATLRSAAVGQEFVMDCADRLPQLSSWLDDVLVGGRALVGDVGTGWG